MPTPVPDPVDTVERFAELSALQDDPFAEQDEVLRAAGLDDETWEAIEKRWMDRLSSGGSDVEELTGRFGKTYSETRQRLAIGVAAGPVPDTQPTGAGFLSTEAQPWRAEAAEVGRDVAPEAPPRVAHTVRSVADTLDCPTCLPVPLLPFHSAATPSHAAPDATLEPGAHLPLPALPFGPAH